MAKSTVETDSFSVPATKESPRRPARSLGESIRCASRWEVASVAVCVAIGMYTALLPIYRAFLMVEASYNEGWNAYNAEAVAHHLLVYTARYGWTTMNYPILSFYVIGGLSHLTHDVLYTGRFISLASLAITALLVGLTVRKLTGAALGGVLAAFILVGCYCSNADFYVGVDDPQLFALAFFAAGLLVYVSRKESLGAIALAATLFVIGGNIKHNLIDIVLVVMLDLALVNRKRLLQFSVIGAALVAVSILLNIKVGGPYFVQQILTPRPYAVQAAMNRWKEYYPLLMIPFLLAAGTSLTIVKDKTLRIASIMFWTTLVVGTYFAGGYGVSINAFFSNTVAIAILLGIGFERLRESSERWPRWGVWLRAGVPLFVFAWFFVPLGANNILLPWENYAQLHAKQARFEQQVAVLRSHPGPALCESLLRCYEAGKPYVYDPFNSTSLIVQGKLDPSVILARIEGKQYGAIQFSRAPLPDGRLLDTNQRFVDPLVYATAANYQSELCNDDCAIYVPRTKQ